MKAKLFEPGYYWIKDSSHAPQIWFIAYCDGKSFWNISIPYGRKEEVDVVGYRIPTPDEQQHNCGMHFVDKVPLSTQGDFKFMSGERWQSRAVVPTLEGLDDQLRHFRAEIVPKVSVLENVILELKQKVRAFEQLNVNERLARFETLAAQAKVFVEKGKMLEEKANDLSNSQNLLVELNRRLAVVEEELRKHAARSQSILFNPVA